MSRPSSAVSRLRHGPVALLVVALATGVLRAADPAVAAIPRDLEAFQRDTSPLVLARRPAPAKHWRQIEPAVHQLALAHADRLAALAPEARIAALAAFADCIDRCRTAAAATPVFAPGRHVIGLLDPAEGLAPGEITALASAYGCTTQVLKQDPARETIPAVATAFLAAVTEALAADKPTTIVVLGHGLPTEIQSYSIRFERLADALLDGAARAPGGPGRIDLGRTVLVCDDCFSADFLVNLLDALEARCRDRGAELVSLPACIAGTNHGRVGRADVGATFVPHFWRDVIELYFVRRPWPAAVTLRNFFENVDNMMYGYGRAPIMEGATIAGWRLVDPALVQDPVVFLPLAAAEQEALRTALGLPATAPLPRWLDAG